MRAHFEEYLELVLTVGKCAKKFERTKKKFNLFNKFTKEKVNWRLTWCRVIKILKQGLKMKYGKRNLCGHKSGTTDEIKKDLC